MRAIIVLILLLLPGCVHRWPDKEWCEKRDAEIARHRAQCKTHHPGDDKGRLFCFDVMLTSEEMHDIVCHPERTWDPAGK